MAMAAIDPKHHIGGMGYDSMHYPQTNFNNPWTAAQTASSTTAHMYPTSSMPTSSYAKPNSIPMPQYSMPTSAPTSYPTAYSQPELINPRHTGYDSGYASATSHPVTYAPSASIASYAPMNSYAHSLVAHQHDQQDQRRGSTTSDSASIAHSHSSFGDAIEASRGMVAMSQTDITPRNIYGPRPGDRTALDSYGFPSAHSSHSSISSNGSAYGGGHYGYASSVADSQADYSSASESADGLSYSRTLPRPAGLPGMHGGGGIVVLPPSPASMMGSFNSKVSASAQKKHKCRVCEKRFTRPSSLQTHLYSHTGEKPFACDVAGCGRNFSVVSNLRRHRKVHKSAAAAAAAGAADARSVAANEDGDDENEAADRGSPASSWTSERHHQH